MVGGAAPTEVIHRGRSGTSVLNFSGQASGAPQRRLYPLLLDNAFVLMEAARQARRTHNLAQVISHFLFGRPNLVGGMISGHPAHIQDVTTRLANIPRCNLRRGEATPSSGAAAHSCPRLPEGARSIAEEQNSSRQEWQRRRRAYDETHA